MVAETRGFQIHRKFRGLDRINIANDTSLGDKARIYLEDSINGKNLFDTAFVKLCEQGYQSDSVIPLDTPLKMSDLSEFGNYCDNSRYSAIDPMSYFRFIANLIKESNYQINFEKDLYESLSVLTQGYVTNAINNPEVIENQKSKEDLFAIMIIFNQLRLIESEEPTFNEIIDIIHEHKYQLRKLVDQEYRKNKNDDNLLLLEEIEIAIGYNIVDSDELMTTRPQTY